MPAACGDQKKVSDPLELDSAVTENCINSEAFECNCIFGTIVEKPLSKSGIKLHQNLLFIQFTSIL